MSRSDESSAVASVGLGQHQRPLGGDALADGDPFLGHHRDAVGGPPGGGGDHRGHPVDGLVPGAGHGADVGERQWGETAITRLGQDIGAGRHRGHPSMVEDRAFREPGGAAGPHHGHRIGRLQVRPGAGRRAGKGRCHFGAVHHPAGGSVGGFGPVIDDRHRRSGAIENRPDLMSAEPGVDPRGHRPHPGGGGEADHVVEGGRQDQADDRAPGHSEVGQQAGDTVGRPVPLPEGQRPPRGRSHRRLHVRLDVAVLRGRRPQHFDHGGELPLNLTRRHIGADCNRGDRTPISRPAARRVRPGWFPDARASRWR